MRYKSYILLGYLLALVACSKQAAVVPANVKLASQNDCQQVYHHIIELVAMDVMEDKYYTIEQYDAIILQVEQQMREEGKNDRFMLTCLTSMTKQQAECALHTKQVAGITTCIKLFPRKKS